MIARGYEMRRNVKVPTGGTEEPTRNGPVVIRWIGSGGTV